MGLLKANTVIEVSMGGATVEYEAEIRFTYTPGSPEMLPSYSHGGLPPDPAEIEIENVLLKLGSNFSRFLPQWMLGHLEADDELYDFLCREAEEIRAAPPAKED